MPRASRFRINCIVAIDSAALRAVSLTALLCALCLFEIADDALKKDLTVILSRDSDAPCVCLHSTNAATALLFARCVVL